MVFQRFQIRFVPVPPTADDRRRKARGEVLVDEEWKDLADFFMEARTVRRISPLILEGEQWVGEVEVELELAPVRSR